MQRSKQAQAAAESAIGFVSTALEALENMRFSTPMHMDEELQAITALVRIFRNELIREAIK